MLRTRVIPVLLLQNFKLIKTIKFSQPTYIGDPINAVRIFNEKEVDELILLDTTKSKENKDINYNWISDIVSESFMPLAYGGGISNLIQIKTLFKIGIEKIILNSNSFNYSLISEAVQVFGSQSILACIDVKKNFLRNYEVYTLSGSKKQKISIFDHLTNLLNSGVGEICLQSIDRDGTMTGYDIELIKQISGKISVPLIALGGAGTIEDLRLAKEAGASALACGSMFVFRGKHRAVLINYPQINNL